MGESRGATHLVKATAYRQQRLLGSAEKEYEAAPSTRLTISRCSSRAPTRFIRCVAIRTRSTRLTKHYGYRPTTP